MYTCPWAATTTCGNSHGQRVLARATLKTTDLRVGTHGGKELRGTGSGGGERAIGPRDAGGRPAHASGAPPLRQPDRPNAWATLLERVGPVGRDQGRHPQGRRWRRE